MRTAYTSTVVARGHVGVGVGLVALLVLRPWEVGLAAAVVLVISAWWAATVRLVVGPDADPEAAVRILTSAAPARPRGESS